MVLPIRSLYVLLGLFYLFIGGIKFSKNKNFFNDYIKYKTMSNYEFGKNQLIQDEEKLVHIKESKDY